MKLIPKFDYLVVDADVEVESELWVPDTVKIDDRAVVVSVADDVEDFSVGDIVVFPPRVGRTVTVDRKDFKILKSTEIIGVLVD